MKKKSIESRMNRRGFLKVSGGAFLCLAGGDMLGHSHFTWAADEIPILGIFPITGPYAEHGILQMKAMQLAIDHNGGKVLGKPIKFVQRDEEGKAGVAVRRCQEAIATDMVKAMVGPGSSGSALGVADVAKHSKVVHFFAGATEEISGKRCHPYAFQWAASPYQVSKVLIDKFLKENPNRKRWYTLCVDYVFGHTVRKYLEMVGKDYGIEFVGNDNHPFGEREFGQYMTKIMAKEPDVLCITNFGQDAIGAVREAYNYGVKKKTKIIMTWSTGLEEFRQLTPEMREDVYAGTNFYYDVAAPLGKKFVEDYWKIAGEPPGYAPASSYSMTRIILLAMERAKSAEPEAVAKVMEGFEFDCILGKMKIRSEDHQTIRPYFFLKCKKKSEMKHPFDFADIIAIGSDPMPLSMSECKGIKW